MGQLIFTDAKLEGDNLGEHLVIEDKIVGITQKRQPFEHFAREGPVTAVILGELGPAEKVLEERQCAVGEVLVERHSAAQCGAAQMRDAKTAS